MNPFLLKVGYQLFALYGLLVQPSNVEDKWVKGTENPKAIEHALLLVIQALSERSFMEQAQNYHAN